MSGVFVLSHFITAAIEFLSGIREVFPGNTRFIFNYFSLHPMFARDLPVMILQ